MFIASDTGSLFQEGAISDVSTFTQTQRILLSLLPWSEQQETPACDIILYRESADHQPWLVARMTHANKSIDSLEPMLGPQVKVGLSLIAKQFLTFNGIRSSLSHLITNDLPLGIKSMRLSSSYVKDPLVGSLSASILIEIVQEQAYAPPLPSALTAIAPVKVQREVSISNIVQDGLLRAEAMISAIPCIATLMELHPSNQDPSGPPGQLFTGRILMQNELSLIYWGELDGSDPKGSWLLVKTLLASQHETEASPSSLLSYLKRVKQTGHRSVWQHIIKVWSSHKLNLQKQPLVESVMFDQELGDPDPSEGNGIKTQNSGLPSSRGGVSYRSQTLSRDLSSTCDIIQREHSTSLRRELSTSFQREHSTSLMSVIPSRAMMSLLTSLEHHGGSNSGVPTCHLAEQPVSRKPSKDESLGIGSSVPLEAFGSCITAGQPSLQGRGRDEGLDRTSRESPSSLRLLMDLLGSEDKPPMIGIPQQSAGTASERAPRVTKLNNDSSSANANADLLVAIENLYKVSKPGCLHQKQKMKSGSGIPEGAEGSSHGVRSVNSIPLRFQSPVGSLELSGHDKALLASLPEDEPIILGQSDKSPQAEEVKEMRWHEVQAVPVQDPVTGKDAVLLLQTDITSRAIMEQRMAALTESQLSMLEEMFPRHVLEFIMGAAPPESTLGDLAYQHDDVTILFMDIVGFTSMSKEVPAQMVMEFLNNLFSKFDLLLDDYDVYKVIRLGL